MSGVTLGSAAAGPPGEFLRGRTTTRSTGYTRHFDPEDNDAMKVTSTPSKLQRAMVVITAVGSGVTFLFQACVIVIIALILTRVQTINSLLKSTNGIASGVYESTMLPDTQASLANVRVLTGNATDMMTVSSPRLVNVIGLVDRMLTGLGPNATEIIADQINTLLHRVVAMNITRTFLTVDAMLTIGERLMSSFERKGVIEIKIPL